MLAKLYKFVVAITPPVALPAVLYLLTSLRFLSYKHQRSASLAANRNLRDLRQSDVACILATGPSMKSLDLTRLEGVDFFSGSNFFLHEQTRDLDLRLYFFAPFHPPLVESEYVDWLRAADEKLPPHTHMVLGYQTKAMVEQHGLFPDREVYYLSLEKAQLSRFPDVTKTVLSPHTLPLMILPVLLDMGYKRILLVGCDHTALKDYGGTVQNFYRPDQEKRSNATSGDRWTDGIVWHLKHTADTFEQYEHYARNAAGLGVSVENLSSDSWLECFQKSDFESAVRSLSRDEQPDG